jgi:hypothetical protein
LTFQQLEGLPPWFSKRWLKPPRPFFGISKGMTDGAATSKEAAKTVRKRSGEAMPD